MNYIKQVTGEMRQQPLSVWLSVGGTALSLFLVMAVFIINDLPSVEAKPESCRRSLMVGEGVDLQNEEGWTWSSSGMSKKTAEFLYGNLEGIEKISFIQSGLTDEDASIPGGENHTFSQRGVDNVFWSIFDYDFVDGKPFSKAESDAGMKVAVISEKVARILFGTAKAAGKEFHLRQIPYRVVGVIKDVNPLFDLAYSDVFIPFQDVASNGWAADYVGQTQVLLLKEKGVSYEDIKRQVKNRYLSLQAKLKKENKDITYHEAPYSMEVRAISHGSNTTPDPKEGRIQRFLIYGILLLIPAINLSGMSRSRLRRRVSEIGVRRAFGATRLNVIGQLLGENFIITVLGGAVGLIFCIAFILLFSNLFVNMTSEWFPSDTMTSATPDFSMIFTWRAFGFALIFCFLLNLLSAGFPILKATSINPAEAISGNETIKR